MKLMGLYFDAVSHSACWVAERVHISFDLFGRKILRSGDLSSMLGCARNNSFEMGRGMKATENKLFLSPENKLGKCVLGCI